MFQMNISQTIFLLREIFRSSNREEGLIVSISVSMDDFDTNSLSTRLCFLLIGNISVWVGRDRVGWESILLQDWEFLSSHDSCWRSTIEDYLAKIYFKFAEELNILREKAGFLRKAPRDFSSFNSIDIFHPYTLVEVKYELDSSNNYKKAVTLLKERSK